MGKSIHSVHSPEPCEGFNRQPEAGARVHQAFGFKSRPITPKTPVNYHEGDHQVDVRLQIGPE